MSVNSNKTNNDSSYICVKSLERGVNVMGLTRGENTKFHHTEKLDEGEVLIVQFTENTSAIKVRGNAEIHTPFGMIHSGGSVDSAE